MFTVAAYPSLRADAEEAPPAVSAFPWAKPLCGGPLKRGCKNETSVIREPYLGSWWRRDPYGAATAVSHL